MSSFFKRIARIFAKVLAIIAVILLVIAIIISAHLAPYLLPALFTGLEATPMLFLAFACATIAIMIDEEAALEILNKMFDAVGKLTTSVIDKTLEVIQGVSGAVAATFMSSPLGILLVCGAGFLIYKKVSSSKSEPNTNLHIDMQKGYAYDVV